MSLIKCIDCNSKISEKAVSCPHCGCPVSDSIAKKKADLRKKILIIIIPILVIIISVIITLVVINRIKSNELKNGYYNNIKWGISKEELQGKLGDNATDNASKQTVKKIVDDYEGLGVKASEIYSYKDGFYNVTIMLSESDSYSADVIFSKLTDIFDKRYSKHTEEKSYENKWTTSKSEIKVMNLLGIVIVDYKDITRTDED